MAPDAVNVVDGIDSHDADPPLTAGTDGATVSVTTNDWSAPCVVAPRSSVATTRQCTVLFHARPGAGMLTGTAAAPDPAEAAALAVPYAVVGPYSMYQVVAWPLGFTVPGSVAPPAPFWVAAPAVTAGAPHAVAGSAMMPSIAVRTATSHPARVRAPRRVRRRCLSGSSEMGCVLPWTVRGVHRHPRAGS